MIPTSRNVSTFFSFWHFPIHAQRMCAVKSWILQWEHAVSNTAPNVPAGGKMSPQGPRLQDHVMTTCGDRSGLQDGLWAAWGSGGKGPHWPLTIQLQTLACLDGRGGGQNPGLIFLGLLDPKAFFPAWWQRLMGTRVEGYRFWGKRVTVPPWESCGPRPPNHPAWATEELGKSWVSGALRMDMLRRRLEKQGLELPGKRCRVTRMPRDASIAISVIIKGNCYIPSD